MSVKAKTCRAVVLLVLLVGVTGACSSSHDKTAGRPTSAETGSQATSSLTGDPSKLSPGDPVSTDVLVRAIAATKSVTSGHFTVGGELGADSTDDAQDPEEFMKKHHAPDPPGSGFKGAFDRAHDLGRVDLGALGLKSLIVDGDHAYVELPAPESNGVAWQELSNERFLGMERLFLLGLVPNDPVRSLQDVSFVGSDATFVGPDELNGAPVEHFEAHMNLSRMDAAVSARNTSYPFETLRRVSPEADDVPVHLWIDEAGRVVRIWFAASYDLTETLREKSKPDAKPQTVTSHTAIAFDLTFAQLDEPVSIDLPPADQIAPPTTAPSVTTPN